MRPTLKQYRQKPKEDEIYSFAKWGLANYFFRVSALGPLSSGSAERKPSITAHRKIYLDVSVASNPGARRWMA